jgi:hypothetical protein
MIILGMTACGKTHYLVQELKSTFLHQFENIFLIFPTYQWNRTYDKDSFTRMIVSLSFPADRTT